MKCLLIITQFFCLGDNPATEKCFHGVTSTPPISYEACLKVTNELTKINRTQEELKGFGDWSWETVLWHEDTDTEGEDK